MILTERGPEKAIRPRFLSDVKRATNGFDRQAEIIGDIVAPISANRRDRGSDRIGARHREKERADLLGCGDSTKNHHCACKRERASDITRRISLKLRSA